MGISIKRVSNYLWLAIDVPQPIFDILLVGHNDQYNHYLWRGHYLLRSLAIASGNPDLQANDSTTMTLYLKTPYGFADGV